MGKSVNVGTPSALSAAHRMPRRLYASLLVGLVLVACAFAIPGCGFTPGAAPLTLTSAATSDRLRSWNDTPAKRQLLEFVYRVTTEGPDFVPVEDRIAVFDNDGTLWQEKPLAEGAFVVSRIEQLASKDPSIRTKEPFKTLLEHDV
jgi:hypothetical protein